MEPAELAACTLAAYLLPENLLPLEEVQDIWVAEDKTLTVVLKRPSTRVICEGRISISYSKTITAKIDFTKLTEITGVHA